MYTCTILILLFMEFTVNLSQICPKIPTNEEIQLPHDNRIVIEIQENVPEVGEDVLEQFLIEMNKTSLKLMEITGQTIKDFVVLIPNWWNVKNGKTNTFSTVGLKSDIKIVAGGCSRCSAISREVCQEPADYVALGVDLLKDSVCEDYLGHLHLRFLNEILRLKYGIPHSYDNAEYIDFVCSRLVLHPDLQLSDSLTCFDAMSMMRQSSGIYPLCGEPLSEIIKVKEQEGEVFNPPGITVIAKQPVRVIILFDTTFDSANALFVRQFFHMLLFEVLEENIEVGFITSMTHKIEWMSPTIAALEVTTILGNLTSTSIDLNEALLSTSTEIGSLILLVTDNKEPILELDKLKAQFETSHQKIFSVLLAEMELEPYMQLHKAADGQAFLITCTEDIGSLATGLAYAMGSVPKSSIIGVKQGDISYSPSHSSFTPKLVLLHKEVDINSTFKFNSSSQLQLVDLMELNAREGHLEFNLERFKKDLQYDFRVKFEEFSDNQPALFIVDTKPDFDVQVQSGFQEFVISSFENKTAFYVSVWNEFISITDAKVTVNFTSGNTPIGPLELLDDGEGADINARDGVYSMYMEAICDENTNGFYSAIVSVKRETVPKISKQFTAGVILYTGNDIMLPSVTDFEVDTIYHEQNLVKFTWTGYSKWDDENSLNESESAEVPDTLNHLNESELFENEIEQINLSTSPLGNVDQAVLYLSLSNTPIKYGMIDYESPEDPKTVDLGKNEIMLEMPNLGSNFYHAAIAYKTREGKLGNISNVVNFKVISCEPDCENGICLPGVSGCKCDGKWKGKTCMLSDVLVSSIKLKTIQEKAAFGSAVAAGITAILASVGVTVLCIVKRNKEGTKLSGSKVEPLIDDSDDSGLEDSGVDDFNWDMPINQTTAMGAMFPQRNIDPTTKTEIDTILNYLDARYLEENEKTLPIY